MLVCDNFLFKKDPKKKAWSTSSLSWSMKHKFLSNTPSMHHARSGSVTTCMVAEWSHTPGPSLTSAVTPEFQRKRKFWLCGDGTAVDNVAASMVGYRLGGLVVKASASGAEDPGFESRLHRDFSGSSHASDLKIGTPVATLPGAWRYRVSAGTGRPGVSILWLGEIVWSATCISVWQHVKLSEQIRPWDTLACCWDAKQPTNKQTMVGLKRRSHMQTSHQRWWTPETYRGFPSRLVYLDYIALKRYTILVGNPRYIAGNAVEEDLLLITTVAGQ